LRHANGEKKLGLQAARKCKERGSQKKYSVRGSKSSHADNYLTIEGSSIYDKKKTQRGLTRNFFLPVTQEKKSDCGNYREEWYFEGAQRCERESDWF
jgi:hypothetical protein